jgi:hypothetical protein
MDKALGTLLNAFVFYKIITIQKTMVYLLLITIGMVVIYSHTHFKSKESKLYNLNL